MVRWKIFGRKRVEVTGEWRRLHNEELYDLYTPPYGQMKENQVRGACSTYGEEEKCIHVYGG